MKSVNFFNQTFINAFYQRKNYIAALLCILLAFGAKAQVGVGTITPDPSAQFEVQAPNKGVLIPRMNQASRDGIANPASGLLIYQTDATPGFYYFDGATWQPLKTPATPPGGGAIIPYASGTPITMTTLIGGLTGTSALIGFGNSASGVTAFGNTIDLTGGGGTLLNMSFSSPKNGTITSMSAQFSTTLALSLVGTSVNVTAQLYHATAGSNSFTPIPGAIVSLAPAFSGILAIGTTSSSITSGLSIPVIAGDRYLLVFSSTAFGLALINSITGYASAGVAIN